ncbi:hypothetical protein TWF730_000860 [Orbilia blumenaviensis]|uniref:Uncharacterized protein n=1 Tax=Orbilia blumenaviensis TaxID=1796055 RepID=A0AAV9VMW8_9PEZI
MGEKEEAEKEEEEEEEEERKKKEGGWRWQRRWMEMEVRTGMGGRPDQAGPERGLAGVVVFSAWQIPQFGQPHNGGGDNDVI